jgi:hypothetical protein
MDKRTLHYHILQLPIQKKKIENLNLHPKAITKIIIQSANPPCKRTEGNEKERKKCPARPQAVFIHSFSLPSTSSYFVKISRLILSPFKPTEKVIDSHRE